MLFLKDVAAMCSTSTEKHVHADKLYAQASMLRLFFPPPDSCFHVADIHLGSAQLWSN